MSFHPSEKELTVFFVNDWDDVPVTSSLEMFCGREDAHDERHRACDRLI